MENSIPLKNPHTAELARVTFTANSIRAACISQYNEALLCEQSTRLVSFSSLMITTKQ